MLLRGISFRLERAEALGKMSRNYDNWERLVAAVLKKQQLWELFHQNSRSPSVLSDASDFSSSSSSFRDVDFSNPASSSTYWKQLEDAVANSQKLLPKLVFISDFSPAFDVTDVSLASAKLLGRGTFGSLYTAEMHNGVRIVVKRVNSVSITEPKFKSQMDIVGNVMHQNVVPLRAYYSSEDEKLMLYDYYSDGSAYALLHGHCGENGSSLDWETRVRIFIGAARGIAEIHAQNGGKLVHGNIKSSNIFLNAKQYGCVSDLGVANMIATKFVPTARCYAPEIKNNQNVSQESDVYSFGILLLELLTGKSPEAVDLVKLVKSVKSFSKVFDDNLWKHPTLQKEQIVKVLEIGIGCVAKSPRKRPKMSKIVKMLEDLCKMNTGSSVSLEQKLVFFEDSYPTFELEDMLKASGELLGERTFGTCYKATFKNGKSIVVKRLKHVVVECRQHLELIGRMRHKNVAELRAYYYDFSRNELLLVYDYYNQESISTLLHGASRTPFDWETRLKVAVGAARGIAYIHKQHGRNLVHGNIESSNIILDGQRYGIVSDTGHANLTSSIRRSVIPSFGYFAPEVKDTRKMSQASDVYSFGVVLLELVSGRPSKYTTSDGKVIAGQLVELVTSIQSGIRDKWTAEVFDTELLKYPNIQGEMEQVLQIAMDCVAIAPQRRPRMSEVVKVLEEISGINRLDEPSTESRLEDVLEDLLFFLG